MKALRKIWRRLTPIDAALQRPLITVRTLLYEKKVGVLVLLRRAPGKRKGAHIVVWNFGPHSFLEGLSFELAIPEDLTGVWKLIFDGGNFQRSVKLAPNSGPELNFTPSLTTAAGEFSGSPNTLRWRSGLTAWSFWSWRHRRMDPYFTLNNVALMLSKLAQVVVPLVIYVLLRNIGRRTHVVGRFVEKRFAGSSLQERNEWKDRITRAFDRLGGFLGWKVGCDLGYFVITGHSVWQAFTLAGLIPYTVVQYLVYRIFCQKMLFSGMTNPFAYERYRMPRLSRRRNVRRFLAKFLHEDCNATSGNVPLRRVFLKPFGDFFAVVLAWSAYTMGIFWLQDGELNLQPVTQFSYVMMGGYYLGGILAYIWGII